MSNSGRDRVLVKECPVCRELHVSPTRGGWVDETSASERDELAARCQELQRARAVGPRK